MRCKTLVRGFVVACLMVVTTALHQSSRRLSTLRHLKSKEDILKRCSLNQDHLESFPEMEMLLAKANVKVTKSREEKPIDESISEPTANALRENRKAEQEKIQRIVEETQMSSSAATETIKSMIQLATDGRSRREQFDNVLSDHDGRTSSQQGLIADIEDAKSRVSYVDKHGQRYKVPISSKPLWYVVD